MEVKSDIGRTEYGPGVEINLTGGVEINLTGDEVAIAIEAYLLAHKIRIHGARTITVNGKLCKSARVYVEPGGFVLRDWDVSLCRGPGED